MHTEISSHATQEATGLVPQPIEGIIVTDSDVLVPENSRPGGLFQRSDSVCSSVYIISLLTLIQQHTFRKPAKPLEPPTPRASILGLDRLAIEKRAAAAAERSNEDGSRKKPRLDDGDEPFFKGTHIQLP